MTKRYLSRLRTTDVRRVQNDAKQIELKIISPKQTVLGFMIDSVLANLTSYLFYRVLGLSPAKSTAYPVPNIDKLVTWNYSHGTPAERVINSIQLKHCKIKDFTNCMCQSKI